MRGKSFKKGDIIVVNSSLDESYWVVKYVRDYSTETIITSGSLFIAPTRNNNYPIAGIFNSEEDMFSKESFRKPTKFEKFWFNKCYKEKRMIGRNEIEKLYRINKIEIIQK